MSDVQTGPYQRVLAAHPGKSQFDLSHDVKLTCDMGKLIPFLCEEAMPGDRFSVGIQAAIRLMPMVAPVLHEINAYFDWYFVPFRLLWPEPNGWETFITGGPQGTDAPTLPRWTSPNTALGTLWDYFGFPTGVDTVGAYPMAFPRRAYNLVYNTFYRDQQLIAEVSLDQETVLTAAWRKDYFTSALPWQQRGTAPALPVTGSVTWDPALILNTDFDASSTTPRFRFDTVDGKMYVYKSGDNDPRDNARQFFNSSTVSLVSYTVADLRQSLRLQEYLERNARGGARYTEWLRMHFGVSPRDERLQRPEYIGGCKFGVMVSEVLQTSSTDATTPQGNMAGHGLVAGQDFGGNYHAQEFGYVLGIMRVLPTAAYSQGVPRMFNRTSRYDFPDPAWMHLAEQAIIRAEIYADNNSTNNNTIFGYQGRFNELRARASKLLNLFRVGVAGTLDYWHLGRNFSSAPALNQAFIECVPSKRIFAATSQPACLVNIANVVRAIRPMPVQAEPST